MEKNKILRDTILKVDLNKISKNIKLIRDMVGPKVAIMAVVKANGYGHGAVDIAPAIMNAGADYLSVATLSEALEIRNCYADYPILIMGHTPNGYLEYAVVNNISLTIFSYDQALLISKLAQKFNVCAKVHIKIDTGFHRLGKEPNENYFNEISAIMQLPNIEFEGIFSHLALVNDAENEKQFSSFVLFVNKLKKAGFTFRYEHIADSIACVDFPEYRLNMIRPGALIYGMRGFHKGFLPVDQAISFETQISQIHTIMPGEGVSYDYLWKAQVTSRVATLPFGYADGYPRNLRDKGYVIINGLKAPIIGVICMDQCIADVTNIPNAVPGMKAVIYGDGKDGSMDINEVAILSGTNKNDILSRISLRVPRVYQK